MYLKTGGINAIDLQYEMHFVGVWKGSLVAQVNVIVYKSLHLDEHFTICVIP